MTLKAEQFQEHNNKVMTLRDMYEDLYKAHFNLSGHEQADIVKYTEGTKIIEGLLL